MTLIGNEFEDGRFLSCDQIEDYAKKMELTYAECLRLARDGYYVDKLAEAGFKDKRTAGQNYELLTIAIDHFIIESAWDYSQDIEEA